MHRLLLLRHAKSSWDDPALSDHARPLNAKGRRAAGAMAVAMGGLGLLRPDLVLVSSSRRTLQTLEALGPLDGARVDVTDDLYLAPWTRLLDALRDVQEETRSVLLLAHNPGLHELALELAGDAASARDLDVLREAYPTCGLAEFEVPGRWGGLARGEGRLLRFLAPRDLPEPAA
ncbi:histidine phosphatase family protein [Roseomonas sp. CCTCC AB2023176]|uniref:SixA phosphatase family protein n=1 Tax=Roseomonas sp. CCTCC AB2023176 TaxID=3342640 RepID=UPI0035DF849C